MTPSGPPFFKSGVLASGSGPQVAAFLHVTLLRAMKILLADGQGLASPRVVEPLLATMSAENTFACPFVLVQRGSSGELTCIEVSGLFFRANSRSRSLSILPKAGKRSTDRVAL